MTTGHHFAIMAQVRAYWEGLREGGALPQRAAIDPRGIEGALEQAFLLEHIAPGIARFRLAGMHLTDLMGMDVRGMPLSAMIDPAGRDRLAGLLERMFNSPAALDLSLEADRGIGRPALAGRVLILPLRGDKGAQLALGCFATEGLVGRSPRRFHIARALLEPIDVPTQRDAPAPALQRQPGFAEPVQPYIGAGQKTTPRHKGHPYLRLVKSDD